MPNRRNKVTKNGNGPLRDSFAGTPAQPDAPRIAEAVIKTFDGIYYTTGFGEGPRNLEPWSSDVDDKCGPKGDRVCENANLSRMELKRKIKSVSSENIEQHVYVLFA
ncbi:hypothetical protein TNCV_3742491 [Trichonephila clavipes]|nr:hypothetical protein TNCV_3742491 [Trichonephila clavipes]